MTIEKKATVKADAVQAASPKAASTEAKDVTAVPAEAPKAPEKKAPAKKSAEKKAAKKTAEKKPAKKAPVKKAAAKVTLILEYQGRQITDEQIVAAVKADWKGAAIQSLEIYAKPEDGAAYYVVNGTETGKVSL